MAINRCGFCARTELSPGGQEGKVVPQTGMQASRYAAFRPVNYIFCGTENSVKSLILMNFAPDLKSPACKGVPVRFRLRAPAHMPLPEIVLTTLLTLSRSAKLSLFRKKSPAAIFQVSQVGPAMPHLASRHGRHCHVIGTVIALVSRILTRLPPPTFLQQHPSLLSLRRDFLLI